MEIEDYKKMSEDELREEFKTNPVFSYMKLAYELSDLPKRLDCEWLHLTPEHDFKIFQRYLKGLVKLRFSLNDLLQPQKCTDDSAAYINMYLKKGMLDITKFWWAIVFISGYSDSIFKRGGRFEMSILEKFSKMSNILTENGAKVICQSNDTQKMEFSGDDFLRLLSILLKAFVSENNDGQSQELTEQPIVCNNHQEGACTQLQMLFEVQLYTALFKKLEKDGILPARSFGRDSMLAELMKFTGRTHNSNFDRDHIKGIRSNQDRKSKQWSEIISDL